MLAWEKLLWTRGFDEKPWDNDHWRYVTPPLASPDSGSIQMIQEAWGSEPPKSVPGVRQARLSDVIGSS